MAAPKPWIDPAKEATATKIALQTGQKTYPQVAAENGKDWKEQIDETVAVLEYARKKGIEMGGVIFDRTEAELTPAEDKPEPEPGAVPGAADQGGGNQPPGQQPGNEQQEGNQPAADGGGQPEGKPDKGV